MSGWIAAEQTIIDSGEGFYLTDTDGNRYIDAFSSLWCNVHGHRVKKIDDAIRDQLDRIGHSTLLGLAQTRAVQLAERLVEITPHGLNKVFYSDSGATSVEIALKMAYQYHSNRGDRNRTKFIALESSYHGDTIGSVSVGGIGLFHGIFRDLLFETYFAPSPHPYRFDGTADQCRDHCLDKIEQLLADHADRMAAIVVEPLVQGASGIIVHPKGFLKGVRTLADKYDVLLIVDEVATGFGRTGKMFACEHEDVRPDLMCLAKGITGGYLPLAATVATQQIYDAFLGGIDEHKTFYHGHTYTGNALGCAAAIASLELFEENNVIASLPEKVEMMHLAFDKIAQLDHVGDTRHCGLMGGIEIVKDKATRESYPYEKTLGAKLCMKMRAQGAMIRPLGDVVVLMPPVAIDPPTLQKLLAIVTNAIQYDLPDILKDL